MSGVRMSVFIEEGCECAVCGDGIGVGLAQVIWGTRRWGGVILCLWDC